MDRAATYNKNNPVKVKLFNMLGVIKRKCAKDGISYDLDSQWLKEKVEAVCEVTGTPFDMHEPGGPFLPVVARRDKSGPFTKDNCQVVVNIYSIANSEHVLYDFCKQYIMIYEILHKNPKFPGV